MGKTKTKVIEGKEEGASAKKAAVKRIAVGRGIFYVKANINNTIVSFADLKGNILTFSSCGNAGFKNTRKGTPYAAAKAVEVLLGKMQHIDVGEVKIIMEGVGPGRESAIRALFNANLNIQIVEDRTPVPFGGPQHKKPRKT